MPRFFMDPPSSFPVTLSGEDARHITRSLRMAVGEELTLCDGQGTDYHCAIDSAGPDSVTVRLLSSEPSGGEPSLHVTLYQGLPKSDKMELIVQKAVELGVCEVIPVAMKRSVVKLDQKKAQKKCARWQEIAKSAAKQAGRGYIPKVHEVLSYREALAYSERLDRVLLPYELAEGMKETKRVITSILPGQSVGIYIGPEGGFEKEEVDQALEQGAEVITLGKRILRTETAGLAALAVLMFHLEG